MSEQGDYAVQSMSDRVAGLVIDAERTSAQLWEAGDRIAARRLEVLAKKLTIARVLLGNAPVS